MKKAIIVLPLSEGDKTEYEEIPGYEFIFKESKDISPEEFQEAGLVIGNISPVELRRLSGNDSESRKNEAAAVRSDPGIGRIFKEPLVLASASPRRKELLKKADIPFVVMPADIDEVSAAGEPADIAEEISSYKAEYVADRLIREEKRDSFVILSADTIVAVDGKVLG